MPDEKIDPSLYHVFHEAVSRCQRCGECMTLNCPCGSLGPHQHFSNDEYREENIEHIDLMMIADEKDFTIQFHVDPNVDIVLHGDGRVEYSVPPDEAAKAFWEAVEMFAINNGISFHRS